MTISRTYRCPRCGSTLTTSALPLVSRALAWFRAWCFHHQRECGVEVEMEPQEPVRAEQ